MADPGLPMRIAEKIAEDIAVELSENSNTSWRVEISQQRLPLDAEGDLPVFKYAQQLRDTHNWNYLVYLTDLPNLKEEGIILCEVSAESQSAMLSVPSAGALRTINRVRRLVSALVSSSQTNTFDYPSKALIQRIMGHRKIFRYAKPDDNDIVQIFLPGWWNRLELLAGMVRSNQPRKLLSALTNSIALGAATGAFGIFYGSVWDLSDALPGWRLLLISIAVIVLMGLWLIIRNGLWTRQGDANARWQARVDNTATIITLSIGVMLLYLTLFCVLFVLSLAVVDSVYLKDQLEHSVGLISYLHLSWLSASLGMLAGAVGSNFNSEDSIREATYSKRVYQRRMLADSFYDDDNA